MPYDPNFIPGAVVPLPTLTPSTLQQAFSGGTPIDHPNFSTVFNQVRGFAVYSAHNIDGDNLLGEGIIDRANFTNDPQVPNALQVDNDRGYRGVPTPADNPWDRGHLARRRALHWPDEATALLAERESARWTNIAPQHGRLNQGPWADIEDWLLDLADDNDRRACVFTGPVFTESDPEIINIPGELTVRIPSGFWKTIVIRHSTNLCAAAFLLWQCDIVTGQPMDFDPVLEQVRITTIEHLAGVCFDPAVKDADPLRFGGPSAACVAAGSGGVQL